MYQENLKWVIIIKMIMMITMILTRMKLILKLVSRQKKATLLDPNW